MRIILKEMHLGIKDESVLRLLHPDASELYNTVCDLDETCRKCGDRTFRLENIQLELFQPVRPRKAAREHWGKIDRTMRGKGGRGGKAGYIAQLKLDGERMVLHFARPADIPLWPGIARRWRLPRGGAYTA